MNQPSLLGTIKEAWQLIYGIKWLVVKQFLLSILLICVTLLPMVIVFSIVMAMGSAIADFFVFVVCLVAFIYVCYRSLLIIIPIYVICFLRGQQLYVNMDEIIANRDKNINRLVALIVFIILSGLLFLPFYNDPLVPFLAPLIHNLILLPIYYLSIPLILVNNLGTRSAVELSYKVYIRYAHAIIPWVLLFYVIPQYLLLGTNNPIMILLIVLLQSILAIWLVPLVGVMYGIAYREYKKSN